MAKYGINKEGVDAMIQLSNDLNSFNKDIADVGKKLERTINSLGDDLGIYGDQILDLVKKINREQEKGRDSIQQLSAKVTKKANDAAALVSAGF